MLPDMSRLKLGPRSHPTGAGADEAAASVGDKRAAPVQPLVLRAAYPPG